MNTIAKKSVKTGKFLNNQEVATMVSNYKQNRWVDNSEKIGKEDSLTAYCTLEEMEMLIDKIKMYGGDGVRFCFAAYSENHTENPLFSNHQTIVIVGTRKNEAGVAKEIYTSEGKDARILAYGDIPFCPPMCGDPSGKGFGTLVDRGEKGMVIA